MQLCRRLLAAGCAMLISLVHATRGRPEMVASCHEKWLGLATDKTEIEYIVSLDADDQKPANIPDTKMVFGAPLGSTPAYNRGLYSSTGAYVVAVMDDLLPPPGWDKLIVERLGDPGRPALLHVSDGTMVNPTKPWLMTVQIGTRSWFRKAGYMFWPEYRHLFADEDLSRKAIKEKVVIEATDIKFRHHWVGQAYDETAKFNYKPEQWRAGYEILTRRHAAGYPDQPELWK